MNDIYRPRSFASRERGSVLLVSLILVLMLTILGLGSVALNSTQIRIATNTGDEQIAFQTAEATLALAQQAVLSGTYSSADFNGSVTGLYVEDPASATVREARWKSVNWTSDAITSFKGSSSAPAAFIIEKLRPYVVPGQSAERPHAVYRITARAVGASGSAPVILQSVVQI